MRFELCCILSPMLLPTTELPLKNPDSGRRPLDRRLETSELLDAGGAPSPNDHQIDIL